MPGKQANVLTLMGLPCSLMTPSLPVAPKTPESLIIGSVRFVRMIGMAFPRGSKGRHSHPFCLRGSFGFTISCDRQIRLGLFDLL